MLYRGSNFHDETNTCHERRNALLRVVFPLPTDPIKCTLTRLHRPSSQGVTAVAVAPAAAAAAGGLGGTSRPGSRLTACSSFARSLPDPWLMPALPSKQSSLRPGLDSTRADATYGSGSVMSDFVEFRVKTDSSSMDMIRKRVIATNSSR